MHPTPLFFRVLTPLLLIFVASAAAISQGTIIGKVTDGADGSPLWGATVMVEGKSIGAPTNDEGRYRISGLPPGSARLVFRYVGYESVMRDVTIGENETVTLDVPLRSVAIEGEEVVVTGQLRGQQEAINQQISSNTIVNIVSREKIRELPDQNAAEAISRLPGMAIQRDGGEGQKVIVRGLAPKYNTIMVNNIKIPSTDEQDRSVDLSAISSDMLAGIEVMKSLTADKDADAIGGLINFTLKKAPEERQFDIKAQGGMNGLERTYADMKLSASYSERFFENMFGVVLTGNFQRANRGSDVLDNDYSFNGPNILVSSMTLVDRKETRERAGASAVLDYDLEDVGSFLGSVFYSETDRNEVRRRKKFNVNQARIEYDYTDRDTKTQLFSADLSGKHFFVLPVIGPLDVNWNAAHSTSRQHTPFEFQTIFWQTSSFNSRLQTGFGPDSIPAGAFEADSLSRYDYQIADTWLKEMNATERFVLDKTSSAQIDNKVTFDLGNIMGGYVKFGGKYQSKSRDRDNTRNENSTYLEKDFGSYYLNHPTEFYRTFIMNASTGDKIAMGNFLLSNDVVGELLKNRFMYPHGKSAFGPSIDGEAAHAFYANLKDWVAGSTELFQIDPVTDLDDYEASENIYAGYVMSEINVGDWFTLVPGLRYERTVNNYRSITGTPGGGEDETPSLTGVRDTVGERSYEEYLPMIQMRVKPFNWLTIRAAATRTLSRPDFYRLVPYEEINYTESFIDKGNAQLKHTVANNFDLYLSTYNQYGLFSAGIFYKKLWNVDYVRKTNIQAPGTPFHGFWLTQPVNAENPSTVQGVEIELQANMTLLPSPWDGLLFSGNFTLLKSETIFPYFAFGPRSPRPPFRPTIIDTIRTGSMPGQAERIWNFSVGFEKWGFSGRLSMVYQGKSLYSVGSEARLDDYTDEYYRWDLALQQRVMHAVAVFLNVNNITNVPDRAYIGDRRFPTNEEYFGYAAELGIKVTF